MGNSNVHLTNVEVGHILEKKWRAGQNGEIVFLFAGNGNHFGVRNIWRFDICAGLDATLEYNVTAGNIEEDFQVKNK
jgi:hypothetical protein